MEQIIFFIGQLSSLYAILALFFLRTRRRNAPYREAFGWIMLVSYLIVITEFIIAHNSVGFIGTPLYCLDTLVLPLYLLEIDCIVDQDVKATPWRKRWLSLLWFYIPLLMILGIALLCNKETMQWIIVGIFACFSLIQLTYMTIKLRKFHRLLPQDKSSDRSAKWLWKIIPLYIITYIIYLLSDYFASYAFFYIPFMCAHIVHAIMIDKMTASDTTQMYASELEEEQREALDTFKDITEKLKTRVELESRIKAFEMENPGFSAKLRACTETKLTKRDIYLCILICEGKKTGEIAECLAISTTSVEVARHRLRTKLNMDKGSSLSALLTNLLNQEEKHSTSQHPQQDDRQAES